MQIEWIDGVVSAKRIGAVEFELSALRKEIKHRCEAMDAELASYKHLIGRVKYYVDELHADSCQSLSKYVVSIDDIHAVLSESLDSLVRNQTIDELNNRIHELRRNRDSLVSELAKLGKVTSASIAEQQMTIAYLNDELGQQNETIYDLGVKLEACKIDIKDRDNYIKEVIGSHEKLLTTVSNDEYTIKTLREQLGKRDVTIISKNMRYGLDQSEIEQLRSQLTFERKVVDDFRKIIREKNVKIANMEGAIEGDNAELAVRRQDLKVLLDVVDIAKLWKSTYHGHRDSSHDMRAICNRVVDYTKVRQVPEIKGTVQNSGITSIDDAGELITTRCQAMTALHRLLECCENDDNWILYTGSAVPYHLAATKTIDELEQVGHQQDGVILGLRHDCKAKDNIIEEIKEDNQYLHNMLEDKRRTIVGSKGTLRRVTETYESDYDSLAKKEQSQRDQLKRISALLSDEPPHHYLTPRLSLIKHIISEDIP